MITAKHIRAAREALAWSQSALAKRAGVGQPTISAIEREETEAPSSATLTAIEAAFLREGILMTANGIEWRTGASYEFSGADWWLQVLDDVYASLIDQPGAELVLVGADDRLSSATVNNRYRKIRNAGIRMRQFVCEGNTHLLGPLNEYRYVPANRFVNNVMLVYGERVGISADGETKALIVKDTKLAESWRNVVEIMWDALAQPQASTAHERF